MKPRRTSPVGWDPTALVGHPPEDRQARAERNLGVPPKVHRTACLEAFVSVDAGVERATTIGARSYLMKKSHVGHDAIVGEDVEIATGAIVGGYAEIGDGAKIGLNAVVLPFRKVGAGATVGAGSVVTRDVEPGQTVAGNPARPMTRNLVPFSERNGSFDYEFAVLG